MLSNCFFSFASFVQIVSLFWFSLEVRRTREKLEESQSHEKYGFVENRDCVGCFIVGGLPGFQYDGAFPT
jgi:hypothetical protein